MTTNHSSIKFQDTGYFSKIIRDYLDQDRNTISFYDQFPTIEGFQKQIDKKSKAFSDTNRGILKRAILDQSKRLNLSELSTCHIDLLGEKNTFTVTTGHQLNLFTGPLYFLYKIVSAINLAKELKSNFPRYNFVPVYWMATEDHDFDEIRYFNLKGEKLSWEKDVKGAVGRTSLEGLDKVYEKLASLLGTGRNAVRLKKVFKEAYLNHETLTEATRYLANELFGEQGLVIIDGDDRSLKKIFAPYVKEELLRQKSHKEVSNTNVELEAEYSVQVNPREINLFYLDNNLRERIVLENDKYKVNNTDLVFSQSEIIEELNSFPEKFSPNVILRPLYQEVILPNLCYIGGGGELAYWLQLKNFFKSVDVVFPILLLRNSVLLMDQKQDKKLKSLKVSKEEMFLKLNKLIDLKVREISSLEINFSEQKVMLNAMFQELKSLSDKTDKSFSGAVLAQEKKQLNGLSNLEKRLLRAQKRKYKELVNRIEGLQNQLFPGQSLQERQINFSEFYEKYGDALIPALLLNLKPLKQEFDILVL